MKFDSLRKDVTENLCHDQYLAHSTRQVHNRLLLDPYFQIKGSKWVSYGCLVLSASQYLSSRPPPKGIRSSWMLYKFSSKLGLLWSLSSKNYLVSIILDHPPPRNDKTDVLDALGRIDVLDALEYRNLHHISNCITDFFTLDPYFRLELQSGSFMSHSSRVPRKYLSSSRPPPGNGCLGCALSMGVSPSHVFKLPSTDF
ncbi:hypothetical protein AVEN_93388-1 [Araneus ventricosus]|uniref:Uncharacterized protein n=1 Tax=Araneus ventricosus TaxID=182803 RepID=A0A4Y2AP91_ARAVE|nr:hypothetical protein AVEN_93388-1 [Araneus ventricosus]